LRTHCTPAIELSIILKLSKYCTVGFGNILLVYHFTALPFKNKYNLLLNLSF